jgi:hypothetical protein
MLASSGRMTPTAPPKETPNVVTAQQANQKFFTITAYADNINVFLNRTLGGKRINLK